MTTISIKDKLESSQNIICPFCLEKDFDLIGLKHHLVNRFCVEFNQTKNIVANSHTDRKVINENPS